MEAPLIMEAPPLIIEDGCPAGARPLSAADSRRARRAQRGGLSFYRIFPSAAANACFCAADFL